MTELPETCTFIDQIQGTLVGKTIGSAEAGRTHHGFAWYLGDPASYDSILSGKSITGADEYRGCLRVHAQEESLLLSAPPRYHPPGATLPQKHQLMLDFTDGSALTCTVVMWGSMYLYQKGSEATSLPEGWHSSQNPNPYDEAFTLEHFRRMMESCPPKTSVKALLATEQRIPGLGNGCLQDILWTARLNPRRLLTQTSAQQAEDLYRATVAVMREMRDKGGRDTERDLFGQPGGYRTILSSKRKDEPCPSCGGFITREAFLGGNVYFCPVCQPYERKKRR